jgi:DNA-binding NarL/FixJ family response regulator
MRRILQGAYELEETADGEGALELVKDVGDFDVAVVEMRPPSIERGLSGAAAIRALLKCEPGLGIVAHGVRAERHAVGEAMDAGARAYVVKGSGAENLKRAIDAAAESERFIDPGVADRGSTRGTRVTKRQRQILQLIADGQSTAAVAKRLGLSTETVKTHNKQILARLEARDRAHAVAIALRNSLIE